MTIRKGVTPMSTTSTSGGGQSNTVQPHTVVGRQVTRREAPAQAPQQREERRSMIIHPNPNVQQAVRRLVVGLAGKPIRGLSQATVDAHKAYNEAATEQCTRCGEMRPPADMKTVIANAEQPNNPLRICKSECIPVSYKNPFDDRERWKPSVPAIRFDRDSGAAYSTAERGTTINDLITKDSYHKEREVAAEFKTEHVQGEGHWSGASGARVGARVGERVRAVPKR